MSTADRPLTSFKPVRTGVLEHVRVYPPDDMLYYVCTVEKTRGQVI
jgi:hypothetical protein